jgi:hypothetical protein
MLLDDGSGKVIRTSARRERPLISNGLLVPDGLSPVSAADLLVDNLAGWLTAAMTDPAGEFAKPARYLIGTGCWKGWHQLLVSTTELKAAPAVARLTGGSSTEPPV